VSHIGGSDVQPIPVSQIVAVAFIGHIAPLSPQLLSPKQVTSHAHDALQSTPRHELSPPHITSQRL
jgi:hypothetical protein